MPRLLVSLVLLFYSFSVNANWLCSSHMNQEDCNSDGCIWDDQNKCLSYRSKCNRSTEKDSCTKLGCTWAPEQSKCVKTSGMFTSCAGTQDAKSCQERYGCLWQGVNHKCLSNSSLWGASCSEAKESNICNAIYGCLWDSAAAKCLANGFISKSFCAEAKEEKTCKTLSAKNKHCHWDDKSGCFENDQCILAQSAESCSKVKGNCVWEDQKHLCFFNRSSSCEFVSEENCVKKFKEVCTWNSRSKICVENERVTKSLKELDKKTKEALEQFLANNKVEESHLFKFDSSLCSFHDEKQGCDKSKGCTWDNDHLNCVDQHIPFCSYVGKATCAKIAHCIWDDTAHHCYNTDENCAYFKSRDLCKQFSDRCVWDSKDFCRDQVAEE